MPRNFRIHARPDLLFVLFLVFNPGFSDFFHDFFQSFAVFLRILQGFHF